MSVIKESSNSTKKVKAGRNLKQSIKYHGNDGSLEKIMKELCQISFSVSCLKLTLILILQIDLISQYYRSSSKKIGYVRNNCNYVFHR
ncbi:hypothetical protein WN51_09142 [Melipona quadrifasciata]|uniref:Uncharacterized protein n=1 Tax=Melipona quadrifasciata TaxID=166423 RepID=A0A0M9A8E1_9HYME|nr:hypothetical protein WN51_09142 [Melipona quadrifasciata]